MSERYYEAEHVEAYARLRREGLTHWSDLHADGPSPFDSFQGRDFVERVLEGQGRGARLLEYGCGTGAAACHLAARGFAVTAVDLVPDAITMARRFASERGVAVDFAVQDVCRWPVTGDRYDVVLDIFCLQSIVTDEDRSRLFEAVRRRLSPNGRYVIMSAMYEPGRDYGNDRRDPRTGVVWARTEAPSANARLLDGVWYLPNRRHLSARGLRTDLENHGFRILEQKGALGGEVLAASERVPPIAGVGSG